LHLPQGGIAVVDRARLPYLPPSEKANIGDMAMGLGLRDRIGAGLKQAMREKDATRLSTLRLINAAVKDQDIAVRAKGQADGVGEPEVLAILGKMVKQRQESARAYEEAGGWSWPRRNARKSR
jgi:hypothetical protein